jgi:hypothetical protein
MQGFSATVANDSLLEARGVELVKKFQILNILALIQFIRFWLPRDRLLLRGLLRLQTATLGALR